MAKIHISQIEKNNTIKELAIKYRKECPLTTKRSIEYVVNKIYNSIAPKFYIDVYTAKRYLMQIDKGKDINIKNNLKSKMYYDLYTIFKGYLNEGYKTDVAIEKAINTNAPSFYVSKNTIIGILYK